MTVTPFVWSWLFVAAVTAFDVGFAAAHADTFDEWEANPVAAALGFGAAVAVRVVTAVAAFGLVVLAPRRVRRGATVVVVVAHVSLALAYAVGFVR